MQRSRTLQNDRISVKKIEKTLFFIMMWVFFSLNSRYLRIPVPYILRWLFLGALIGCALLIDGVKIGEPPKLLILFLLAVLPSVFYSNDKMESLIKILSLVIVLWGTYIYFNSLESLEDLEIAAKTILWIAILFELQSVGCLLLGLGNGDRATGVTTNPNTLGIYSNISVLAAAYLLPKAKTKRGKWGFFFIIIASAVTAIMSGSRTALVALAFNGVIVAFIKIKKPIYRLAFAVFMTTFAVLLLTGRLGTFGLKSLERLLEGDTSRGEIWELGIDVWKRFPVFGCGYSVSASYNDMKGMENYDFHNSYITILAEVGIWGSALLLIGVFFVFKGAWKTNMVKGQMSIIQIAVIMALELMLAAWSESFMFAVGSTEACLFWVLIAWIIAYKKKAAKAAKEEALYVEQEETLRSDNL
ncbi:MAG: O-antigen ligase family protein [Clostridiales bacterium]|nr:O-antigen ligase family protein [Clostridiales bacterium]